MLEGKVPMDPVALQAMGGSFDPQTMFQERIVYRES